MRPLNQESSTVKMTMTPQIFGEAVQREQANPHQHEPSGMPKTAIILLYLGIEMLRSIWGLKTNLLSLNKLHLMMCTWETPLAHNLQLHKPRLPRQL
jgi:hypothetical protein